ncbi:MAG: VOC family protein [Ardenticatenaceae bacterium]|nr:VOC family protein [Ardenticatenaceae bacterium]
MKNSLLKPDHIVYAVHNLDEAIDYFEQLTGVRPIFGGQHPGRGSHNALLSLGEKVYLEIIAPDPNQPDPPSARSFALDRLREPKLATWAVGTKDIEAAAARSRTAGYDPGDIFDSARSRSDGLHMKWRLTRQPEAIRGDDPAGEWLIPFLIDWGEAPHPAETSPQGCQLVDVRGVHPDPQIVSDMAAALGVHLPVEKGETAQLIATLNTPNGRVILD